MSRYVSGRRSRTRSKLRFRCRSCKRPVKRDAYRWVHDVEGEAEWGIICSDLMRDQWVEFVRKERV
jgi:hypothetical protein